MSQWLEEKYIGIVGSELSRFRRQSRNTYNFRCPFCGDSQKRMNIGRGYFFLNKGQYFFKCHNCNIGLSLRGFLKRTNESLFREFQLDLLRHERPLSPSSFSAAVPEQAPSPKETTMFGFKRSRSSPLSLPSIASLPTDHLAVAYCRRRQLPDASLSHLYFTDEWTTWLTELGWSYAMPEDHAPRLILPWFDREGVLLGAQARRLDVTGKAARYVTLKRSDDTPKIYGWDRLDPQRLIYVVEGPLDSWFLPNCVAAMGADLLHLHDHYLSGYRAVYIWDNEPRNLDVSRHLQAAIARGLSVVIWPSSIQQKDLNDMAQAGVDLLPLITAHTYHGLRANLEFLRWKKLNDLSSITGKLSS